MTRGWCNSTHCSQPAGGTGSPYPLHYYTRRGGCRDCSNFCKTHFWMCIRIRQLRSAACIWSDQKARSDISIPRRVFSSTQPQREESPLTDWGSFAGPAPKLMVCFCSMVGKECRYSPRRMFPQLNATMCGVFRPRPRLYFSSPIVLVGVDANYLTVEWCFHVLHINSLLWLTTWYDYDYQFTKQTDAYTSQTLRPYTIVLGY